MEISIYLRHWNQNKQKCIPVCSYHNSTPLIMFHWVFQPPSFIQDLRVNFYSKQSLCIISANLLIWFIHVCVSICVFTGQRCLFDVLQLFNILWYAEVFIYIFIEDWTRKLKMKTIKYLTFFSFFNITWYA